MRPRKRIGDILVEDGMLSAEQLQNALKLQKDSPLKLGQLLCQSGMISEGDMLAALSRQLRLQVYDPERYPVDSSLASIIPAEQASKLQVAPLKKSPRLLIVAMTDPTDLATLDIVANLVRCDVEPVVCSELQINALLTAIYGTPRSLHSILHGTETPTPTLAPRPPATTTVNTEPNSDVTSAQAAADDSPVIRTVNWILTQAVRENASDIHLSPEQDTVQLRFRVDGKLKTVPAPNKNMLAPIISRLKILAQMDISINLSPQDGRFTFRHENREINVRVSSVPTIYGENMVLRLLDISAGIFHLDKLGMAAPELARIQRVLRQPYGMILASGPTGSGKSSTLFAMLRERNQIDVNIMTIEDPVEYRLEHARQLQLNSKAGMTFASSLRSVLRQDPDILMVGEIRDRETAQIAVQAAMTGHLLLSTLHTNTAAAAVVRLVDMGIEPFLVASGLLAVVAQRLVRRICVHCRKPDSPMPTVLDYWQLGSAHGEQFMRGSGCIQCANSGFRGRAALFEILVLDDNLRNLISEGATSQAIEQAAVAGGQLTTLRQDALRLARAGITTLEEAAGAVLF